MSININTSGYNPNINAMNPASNLSTGLGSAVNSAQSGIMQSLSQLFNSLSQMFSTGAQNGQFQANQGSQNFGNGLGQAQQMGNQGFNGGNGFGQAQQMGNQGFNVGNGFVQPQQMGNQAFNGGNGFVQPQQMGHQGYNIGNGNGQPQMPMNIDINFGQPQMPVNQGFNTGNYLSQQPMNANRAGEVMNKEFDNIKGADGTIQHGDLQRAVNDPNSSQEVKNAASFLLNNPGAMQQLETADRRSQGRCGREDGKISKGDTAASMVMSDSAQSPAERNATATLQQHSGSLMSGGDQMISREELAGIAAGGRLPNGQQAPADLQNAAQFFTQNPEKFSKLEDTNFYRNSGSTDNKADGKIGMRDMQTALGQ